MRVLRMKINNKLLKDWTEEELLTLIQNESFRENQYLDYKQAFEFIENTDKHQKIRGKNEFRNDVCAFANADGGDLIFGIAETKGLASKIMPIAIKNIDKFELDLRNTLMSIQPSMPNVEFKFISVDKGYVVVVHIDKGIFKPYMTVEDQSVFRFFVRHGNRKDAMSYSEMRNNFLNAASLDAEIKKFRIERLSELLEDNTKMFGVIHIIPATFANTAEFIPMCDLGKAGKLPLPNPWLSYIKGRMIPNVDGVWFPSEDGRDDFQLLRLFNHGTVELKYNLYTVQNRGEEFLQSLDFINAIGEIVDGTVEIYKSFERHATMYVCISIIGCKGYRNYSGYASMHSEPRIDRDRILCAPIEIGDILKAENVKDMVEECKKMTRYALGSK